MGWRAACHQLNTSPHRRITHTRWGVYSLVCWVEDNLIAAIEEDHCLYYIWYQIAYNSTNLPRPPFIGMEGSPMGDVLSWRQAALLTIIINCCLKKSFSYTILCTFLHGDTLTVWVVWLYYLILLINRGFYTNLWCCLIVLFVSHTFLWFIVNQDERAHNLLYPHTIIVLNIFSINYIIFLLI